MGCLSRRKKEEARKRDKGASKTLPRPPPLDNPTKKRTLALQLVDLRLAEALDERELLLAGVRERLDRVDAALEQLLEVGDRDALRLSPLFFWWVVLAGWFVGVSVLVLVKRARGIVAQGTMQGVSVGGEDKSTREGPRDTRGRETPPLLGLFSAAAGSSARRGAEKIKCGRRPNVGARTKNQRTCSAERGIGPPASPSAAATSICSCCSWATGAASMASIFLGRREGAERVVLRGGGLSRERAGSLCLFARAW